MSNSDVISINTVQPSPQTIDEVARTLKDGRLVVLPTETRYGLAARADNQAAVDRVYALKGRTEHAPIAVFLATVPDISSLAELSDEAVTVATKFLPGPVTLVLPSKGVLGTTIEQNGTIGIRVSASPLVRALVTAVGSPLTATSANPSGRSETETIEATREYFGDAVAAYLDGGRLSGPVSTVVDCTGSSMRILREGAIPAEQILACVKGNRS
jgi:L-threonylcarbamoyladenylate synthase